LKNKKISNSNTWIISSKLAKDLLRACSSPTNCQLADHINKNYLSNSKAEPRYALAFCCKNGSPMSPYVSTIYPTESSVLIIPKWKLRFSNRAGKNSSTFILTDKAIL
jgi:hypothetical protein